MKQITNIVLIGVALFALTACGTNNSTTTTLDNDNNSSQLEQGNENSQHNNPNAESNTSQGTQNSNNNIDNYVTPTEFTEKLIVGKTFYEAEDENEDGIFTINEWLQIMFISNSKISSSRDGQKYPTNTYHLEVGKLFFNNKEDGKIHTDIISLTSASQTELNVSTTDGDNPTWIFEVPFKEEMVLGKTFSFQNDNKEYTLAYDSNHTVTLYNSIEKISDGTYEVKEGKLYSTLDNKITTKSTIKVNQKGDLLLWDTNSLKATWYYQSKP